MPWPWQHSSALLWSRSCARLCSGRDGEARCRTEVGGQGCPMMMCGARRSGGQGAAVSGFWGNSRCARLGVRWSRPYRRGGEESLCCAGLWGSGDEGGRALRDGRGDVGRAARGGGSVCVCGGVPSWVGWTDLKHVLAE